MLRCAQGRAGGKRADHWGKAGAGNGAFPDLVEAGSEWAVAPGQSWIRGSTRSLIRLRRAVAPRPQGMACPWGPGSRPKAKSKREACIDYISLAERALVR